MEMQLMTMTGPDGSVGKEAATRGLQVGFLAVEPLVCREDALEEVFFLASKLVPGIFTLHIVVALELLAHANTSSSPPSTSGGAHKIIVTFTVATHGRFVVFVTIFIIAICGIVVATNLIFLLVALINAIAPVLLLNAHIQALPPAVTSSLALQILPTVSALSWLDLTAPVQTLIIFAHTLARFVNCAPVEVSPAAAEGFPKGLVAAHDRAKSFPSCGFACKLFTGVDPAWIAPVHHSLTSS